MKVYEHLNLKGRFNKGARVGTTDDGSSTIITVTEQENHAVSQSPTVGNRSFR